MNRFNWPGEFMPADATLRGLVDRATGVVAQAAPLALALLGGDLALPDPAMAADPSVGRAMGLLATELETLEPLVNRDDEMDRLSLAHGLRRALGASGESEPAGPGALEQHLQLRLLRLVTDPAEAVASLVELVEHGPSFLRGARPTRRGGSRVAGEIAVEAAGRLPMLLDSCAAAGRELTPVALRFRLEAALGVLLQAGAEESGWLLKEYLPGSTDGPGVAPDTLAAGLGLDLAELEAAAEAALADAVLAEPAASPAAPGLGDLAGIRAAWDAAASASDAPAAELEVIPTPAWIHPMVPDLCLLLPGPLGGGAPARLMVGEGATTPAADVALLHQIEFIPWAEQRGHHRAARLLLPAPDIAEGWRAHVRASAPGGEPPWPRELAWRAALALAAISMARGAASVDQAAGLVAAESGMPEATAHLQVLHVRRRPLGALTCLAGRIAVASALPRVGSRTLLSAGPLSAAAAQMLT